jgi:hypothetical protein
LKKTKTDDIYLEEAPPGISPLCRPWAGGARPCGLFPPCA